MPESRRVPAHAGDDLDTLKLLLGTSKREKKEAALVNHYQEVTTPITDVSL
jgi:hypothetical protein